MASQVPAISCRKRMGAVFKTSIGIIPYKQSAPFYFKSGRGLVNGG